MNMERESRGFPQLEGSSFQARAPGMRIAALPGKHRLRQRQALTARLRDAIGLNGLSVHYQPQFETRSGHHCGVEALARWFLPDGGSIEPAIFVRHAEDNGLIAALGSWVINEACTTVAGWQCCGEKPPVLCVNVSPLQISQEFLAVLAGALDRTGLPAAQLELEITEGILIEKPESALDCIAQWKQLGVRIALDDFGTGYSSLSYLSRLGVDRVKLDKSLIHRMTADPKTAAIVRAVISLGADMGFAVLAEGVESEAQLTMLCAMGCQQVQGYLLARPTCAENARALLATNWGKRRVRPTAFDARSAVAHANPP